MLRSRGRRDAAIPANRTGADRWQLAAASRKQGKRARRVHRVTRSDHKLAVVVFQLGGPDSLQAVEPFLYNLFRDPDIIDFPFARLARPTLARLISSRRARHVREHYASIGGKSPIHELTELQARALERELHERHGLDARVFVAMRYWHPLTEEAVAQIARGNFHELILLPLYPQFSKTTTGSSLNEWQRQYARAGKDSLGTSIVHSFYDHPMYLDALIERINEGLARFTGVGEPSGLASAALVHECPPDVILSPPIADEESAFRPAPPGCRSGHVILSASEESPVLSRGQVTADPSSANWGAQGDKPPRSLPATGAGSAPSAESADDVYLVFSAHGVPVRVIEAGDPYQQHIEATVRLVMERGGWPNPHVLCYQSRVNPGKWLEPTLRDTLRSLAASPGSGHLQVGTDSSGDCSGHLQVGNTSRAGLKAAATDAAPRVLVIPISFVTDHVETLAEINIEARALAHELGIAQFELMPALNDSPTFIRALADLVLAQVSVPSRAK